VNVGNLILSGSEDRQVFMWDTRTHLPSRVAEHEGAVRCMDYSDYTVVSASGSVAKFTGKILVIFQ
jgi:WD40 repeat protein